MSFFKSSIALYALSVLMVVLVGWSIFLYQLPDHMTNWNYLFNIGYSLTYLFGAAAAFTAWRTLGGGLVGRGFLFLSLSLVSYAGGQFVWAYYNFAGIDVPYPSVADMFYALFIPFTALAIISFLTIFRMLTKRRVLIESFIVLVLATGAVFLYQASQGLFESSTPLGMFFNIVYLLTDSILITGVVIVIRTSGGTIHKGLVLLAAGYFMDALGDFVFYYRSAKEVYWNGDISDLIFAVSGYLIALATIWLVRELVHVSPAPGLET